MTYYDFHADHGQPDPVQEAVNDALDDGDVNLVAKKLPPYYMDGDREGYVLLLDDVKIGTVTKPSYGEGAYFNKYKGHVVGFDETARGNDVRAILKLLGEEIRARIGVVRNAVRDHGQWTPEDEQ